MININQMEDMRKRFLEQSVAMRVIGARSPVKGILMDANEGGFLIKPQKGREIQIPIADVKGIKPLPVKRPVSA